MADLRDRHDHADGAGAGDVAIALAYDNDKYEKKKAGGFVNR